MIYRLRVTILHHRLFFGSLAFFVLRSEVTCRLSLSSLFLIISLESFELYLGIEDRYFGRCFSFLSRFWFNRPFFYISGLFGFERVDQSDGLC